MAAEHAPSLKTPNLFGVAAGALVSDSACSIRRCAPPPNLHTSPDDPMSLAISYHRSSPRMLAVVFDVSLTLASSY